MSYLPNPGMVVAPGGGNRNAKNIPVHADGREWSYRLFDSFDEIGTCLIATCFPCITYANNKRRFEHLRGKGFPDPERGGSLFNSDCAVHGAIAVLFGLGWVLQIDQRSRIRNRYSIRGKSWEDVCTALWCSPCQLTQESRELELEEQSFEQGGNVGIDQGQTLSVKESVDKWGFNTTESVNKGGASPNDPNRYRGMPEV